MMKLSEAIRLGAMLKTQAFGDLFVAGGSCAWGSAYDAIGDDPSKYGINEIDQIDHERWPITEIFTGCPVGDGCGEADEVGFIISHLNDEHRWTRERVADWVQTIEDAQSPDVEREPVSAEAQEANAK